MSLALDASAREGIARLQGLALRNHHEAAAAAARASRDQLVASTRQALIPLSSQTNVNDWQPPAFTGIVRCSDLAQRCNSFTGECVPMSVRVWRCWSASLILVASCMCIGAHTTAAAAAGAASNAATGAIAVTAGAARSLPTQFYGANGQERDAQPWDQIDPSTCSPGPCRPYNPGFSAALQGLEYGILRYPGGTGANYWNWQSGDSVTHYDPKSLKGAETPPSPYPAPLSELKKELISASQPGELWTTQANYVLNMLTDPLCVAPLAQNRYCTYFPSSPDESYQLRALAALGADGISVPTVELGNEFFYDTSVFPNYPAVFPTVEDYGRLAGQWTSDIKKAYPTMKVAAVGATYGSASPCEDSDPATHRIHTWNCGLMKILAQLMIPLGAAANNVALPDAVTLHIYPESGLEGLNSGPDGTTVNNDDAERMLLTPLQTWDTIVSDAFPSLTYPAAKYTPDIWITEYNVKNFVDPRDPKFHPIGTWAQGLYVATFSLLFATHPRVQMALHHDVQSNGPGGDIFATETGFAGDQLAIGTKRDGYTAMGLTSREIDTAALGQTRAQALVFARAPTFDGTHPKLLGEMFTRDAATASRVVILNLDNVAHEVDLSAVVSSGSYRQIYGDAGIYVDGKLAPDGFQGYVVDPSGKLTEDDLTLDEGPLPARPLSLPPFSITRISGATVVAP
jgi:hypothetical protein